MAKTDAQRGAFGAWVRAQRMALLKQDEDRGIARRDSIWSSADKAQPEIERRTGHRMRPDYLRGIESGNQLPGPDTVDALERAYGSEAPPVRGEAVVPMDQADVAAAIREQTEVMRELVEEIRASRSDAPPWVDSLVAALGVALRGRGIEASAELVESGPPPRGQG